MKKILIPVFTIALALNASSQTTTRLPLVEGLTSNTCGPCANWNGIYGPIIENNNPNADIGAGIAVVKYQMDWPSPGNDPSFNSDGNTRKGFYGTTGIPDWYIDGIQNDATQGMIDDQQATPAELKITAAYTLTGNQIDVTVQIIPLAALGNGNRCYIALTNKSYNYSGGTNGENSFHHVMRKMLPSGAGTYLPNLVANDTIYINESYTFTVASGTPSQNSYDFWNADFEVVCWVQKSTTKAVQNATIAPEGILGIENGEKDDFGMIVYPNPSIENSTVLFDADPSDVTAVSLINQLGEVVYTNNYGTLSGRQRLILETHSFSEGIYYVKVVNGDRIATKPLMITK